MRTFHVGGTASRVQDKSRLDAKNNGFVRFINLSTVESKDGALVAMNRSGSIAIQDERGREKERYVVVYGARLKVKDGEHVKLVSSWPSGIRTLTRSSPRSAARAVQDLQEGITLNEEVDEVTGLSRWVVADSPTKSVSLPSWSRTPRLEALPAASRLALDDPGRRRSGPGDVLAKIPKESTRTRTSRRSARVVELFEARKPRETAIISEIDGIVRFGEVSKGQRKIYVTHDNGEEKEYSVPPAFTSTCKKANACAPATR